MDQHELISVQLEEARQELYQLVFQYGIPHSKVIEQSVIVDTLINSYNRIKYEKRQRPIRVNRLHGY